METRPFIEAGKAPVVAYRIVRLVDGGYCVTEAPDLNPMMNVAYAPVFACTVLADALAFVERRLGDGPQPGPVNVEGVPANSFAFDAINAVRKDRVGYCAAGCADHCYQKSPGERCLGCPTFSR